MPAPGFIVGDWGTTSLRLYLCENEKVIARLKGPGIAGLDGHPRDQLATLIAPWRETAGSRPVFLSGMVGSNLGWVETPYLACPATPSDIAADLTLAADDHFPVFIAPGLRCNNPLEAPDTMRGEETQLIGLMARKPTLAAGRHLVCLPGTHTKWAILENGRVTTFLTSLTGELFALLSTHSVLIPREAVAEPSSGRWQSAFTAGLQAASDMGADSLHSLFSVRGRQLTKELPANEARPFLSGLLTGQDTGAALRHLAPATPNAVVHIVGEHELTENYNLALQAAGVETCCHDGADMVIAGLTYYVACKTATNKRRSPHDV